MRKNLHRHGIVLAAMFLIAAAVAGCGGGGGAVCATDTLRMPDLTAPEEYEVVDSFLPVFSWTYPDSSCHPEGYRIDLQLDPRFDGTEYGGGTGSPATSWTPGESLQPGMEYWWRAAAINGTTLGPYAYTRRFYTGPYCDPTALAAPALFWPENGDEISQPRPLLHWLNGNTGCIPEEYEVQLSPESDFSDTTYNFSLGNPSLRGFPETTLTDCTVYYWKVTARRGGVSGPESPTQWFQTDFIGECPAIGSGSISGKIFHDLCTLIDGPMTDHPGCIDLGDPGGWAADGVYQEGEPGIANVRVRIGVGGDPVPAILWNSVLTDANGEFTFSGLPEGSYTVFVDALEPDNEGILIPGSWTLPRVDSASAALTRSIGGGDALTGVLFGWDYQFLPVPSAEPGSSAGPFFTPDVKPDRMYYRGEDCGPREAEFKVQVADPGEAAGVWLFVRLKSKETFELTAFTEALVMKPLGNGWYGYTLQADAIPDFAKFRESWVQYQFVAYDRDFNLLERSEVFWNMELSGCGSIQVPNQSESHK